MSRAMLDWVVSRILCFGFAGVYDLLVLGAGPAGVTAALEAASRGCHVAVLEPLRKPTGAPTGAYSKCIRAPWILQRGSFTMCFAHGAEKL